MLPEGNLAFSYRLKGKKMRKTTELIPFVNHCPNEKCRWYNPDRIRTNTRWYRLHGYYDSAQHVRIPRFRCLACGKTFSVRTNLMNWYLHFDDIGINEIGYRYLAGASLCELARERGISINMVRTRLRRFFEFHDKKTGASAPA